MANQKILDQKQSVINEITDNYEYNIDINM